MLSFLIYCCEMLIILNFRNKFFDVVIDIINKTNKESNIPVPAPLFQDKINSGCNVICKNQKMTIEIVSALILNGSFLLG